MKLYIKEHIFTWGDQFSVNDELGNPKYFVQGEVFSFGRKLHVYDRFHNEVAFIKQELFTWLPCYHVYVHDRDVAQIHREFSFFRPRFRVDGLNWDVEGHFLAHDYTISQYGKPIVRIQKEWMTWGDCYELDIAPDANELVALAVVLTIDCVAEQDDN